jgi:regulator of protease activity HflC (stomatin/prohibitin superfamily)
MHSNMNRSNPGLLGKFLHNLAQKPSWAVIFGIVFIGLIMINKSFYSVTVKPGEELVVIDHPYFFGHEGTRAESIKEGRHYLWRSSSVKPVTVTPQSASVKFDDLADQKNILLDFETSIQYVIIDSPSLVKNFGDNWFNNNVRAPYLSIVREKVKGSEMSKIMSDTTTATNLDRDVTTDLNTLVKSIKLPIRIVGVSLGQAKPNQTVLAQMNETAAQEQRQKSMVAAAAAERDRKQAETERAAADNAYRNSMNLDTAQFVQLQQVKASVEIAQQYSAACQKAGHCVVTTSASPLVLPTK